MYIEFYEKNIYEYNQNCKYLCVCAWFMKYAVYIKEIIL